MSSKIKLQRREEQIFIQRILIGGIIKLNQECLVDYLSGSLKSVENFWKKDK